jgi:hypothetical protein
MSQASAKYANYAEMMKAQWIEALSKAFGERDWVQVWVLLQAMDKFKFTE